MKKVLLIILIILSFGNAKGNPKYDSIIYINYNLGLNNVLGKSEGALPFGVDFAENARGPGFGFGIGIEVLFRKKLAVRISGAIGSYSTNRANFEKNLAKRFPEESFIYDDNGYFSRGLSGITAIGWEASMSYDFEFEKFIVRPRLNFGFVSAGAVNYSYVTRIPSSNLITNYSIKGKSEKVKQFGLGVEVSPISFRSVSLFVKLNRSRFVNNYTASINDVLSNSTEESFGSSYSVFFLDVGVSLGFDIFKPKTSAKK